MGGRCEGGSQKVALKKKLVWLFLIPPVHETMVLPLATFRPIAIEPPTLLPNAPAVSNDCIDPSDECDGLPSALGAANTIYGAYTSSDDDSGNG